MFKRLFELNRAKKKKKKHQIAKKRVIRTQENFEILYLKHALFFGEKRNSLQFPTPILKEV